MRTHNQYKSKSANDQPSNSNSVSLFEDYAYKSDNKPMIGKVERMIFHGNTKIEYFRPVPIADEKGGKIMVHIQPYIEKDNVYTLSGVSKLIPFKSILVNVNFEFTPDGLVLLESDRAAIASIFKPRVVTRKPRPSPATAQPTALTNGTQTSDGMQRTVVHPVTINDGKRRTERIRVQRWDINNFILEK